MFVHAIVQFLKRVWIAPQDPSSPNGGYWSLVPTQVSENDPLPVDIARSSSLIDESSGTPHLLVRVSNTFNNPLFVKEKNIDTLLIATTTVDTTANRDLLGSTSTELPTLDNCMQYRKLVWFFFRASNADTTYRILARATDIAGTPLGAGWQELFADALPGGANSWGRIEIPSAGDGYYDQYRIEVSVASGTVVLTSKIVGVR